MLTFKDLRLRSSKDTNRASKLLGISKQTLYKIEERKRNPSRKVINKMIEHYNCTYEEIFKAMESK